jgi:MFS transporter, PHS family, inorganic phosphate transporter
MMTAVFANQGWGQFTAALVSLIVVEAYKTSIQNGPNPGAPKVDYCWRLLIGLGCVPGPFPSIPVLKNPLVHHSCTLGVIALYFRLTIPETPRFTMDIERNVQQASQDVDTFMTTGKYYVDPDAVIQRVDAPKASWNDFIHHFGQWKNGKVLLGTAYSWFALDIAFYGLGKSRPSRIRVKHSSPISPWDQVSIQVSFSAPLGLVVSPPPCLNNLDTVELFTRTCTTSRLET